MSRHAISEAYSCVSFRQQKTPCLSSVTLQGHHGALCLIMQSKRGSVFPLIDAIVAEFRCQDNGRGTIEMDFSSSPVSGSWLQWQKAKIAVSVAAIVLSGARS